MKYIILLLLPLFLWAEDMKSLYEKVKTSTNYQISKEQKSVLVNSIKNSLFSNGYTIGVTAGYADVRATPESGEEFGVSLSKQFNLFGSATDEYIKAQENAQTLELQVLENRTKVLIWQYYGNHCITQRALNSKQELEKLYKDIVKHTQKGVDYGEFDASKAIMAQLSLDNLHLQLSQLQAELNSYDTALKTLITFDGEYTCRKIGVNFNKLFNPENSPLTTLFVKNIQKEKRNVELAQQGVNRVSASVNYANEIDTDRYIFNLSIPLNYGQKSEAKQAAALSKSTAAKHQLEKLENSYRYETSALNSRLSIYTKYLKNTEDSIHVSANKLINQSNMRFLAGEESLISMLKATQTKLQMIETVLKLKLDRHNAVSQYMYNYAINPNGVTNDL